MSFEKPSVAHDWMLMVEGEKGAVRENDLYPRLRKWIDGVAPTDILDVGCGQGICSDKIDLAKRHYTGVDLSPVLLARARELYRQKNRTFVAGDAYRLPFPDASFDAVFSIAVWHLLADAKKAAGEMRRVLRPGGHFFLVVLPASTYEGWKHRYTDGKLETGRFEGTLPLADGTTVREVLYLRSEKELRELLAAEKLPVESTETIRNSLGLFGQRAK